MDARIHPAGSLAAGLILLAVALTGCEFAPAVQAVAPQAAAPQQASAGECMPIAAIRALAKSEGVTFAIVKPVALFLQAFNAVPPSSHVTADEIDAAHVGDDALLLFVTGGCVTSRGQLSWGAFRQLVGEGA